MRFTKRTREEGEKRKCYVGHKILSSPANHLFRHSRRSEREVVRLTFKARPQAGDRVGRWPGINFSVFLVEPTPFLCNTGEEQDSPREK
jgi:hypothetical protein